MKLPEIKPIIFNNVKNSSSYPVPSIIKKNHIETSQNKTITSISPAPIIDKNKTEHWVIEVLEKFFRNTALPVVPVKLNPWTTILDISLFIDSHLTIVKANNGISNYKPYYNRLVELNKYLLSRLN